jgi:hypothetical protein
MLLDCLAEDVFDYVGRMTTLGDFADALQGTQRFFTERVTAFVLAGQRDRAIEYVREIEEWRPDSQYWQRWVKARRAFMERDISSICAEYHAQEAETAKELGLGDIWEPAPFAAEVPETERTTRSAEAHFATTPWISRPPGLLEEPPQQPGEVCFAKDSRWRKGHVFMLVPLTPEQAEEKHRKRYNYTLFTRLPEEILLELNHRTGQSPDDPERSTNPAYIPFVEFRMLLHGSCYFVAANFSEDIDDRGILHLHSIDVIARETRESIWYCTFDRKEFEKTIWHETGKERTRLQAALTGEERSQIASVIPDFADFGGLLSRARALLLCGGYGDIKKLNSSMPNRV